MGKNTVVYFVQNLASVDGLSLNTTRQLLLWMMTIYSRECGIELAYPQHSMYVQEIILYTLWTNHEWFVSFARWTGLYFRQCPFFIAGSCAPFPSWSSFADGNI